MLAFRRKPHRGLALVLRGGHGHQPKFFQRLYVSPDRRSVQFCEPPEPGQGNRSGALDFSQETELRERDARRLEDRVIKRSCLSRGGPNRSAIAGGLHSRVYTDVTLYAQAARGGFSLRRAPVN